MAKKSPGYESGWHTTGTLNVLPSIEQVAQRLEKNPDVELHGFNESPKLDGWWSYDAVWTTKDGARVRGRLNIHNQNPSEEPNPEKAALDPRTYNPAATPMKGYFHAFADADRPWDPSWPSPLNIFLERKLQPSYVKLGYTGFSPLFVHSTPKLSTFIQMLATSLPWAVVAFTHDPMDPSDHINCEGVHYDMPLVSRLAPSLYGRVLDIRVMGDAMLEKVNRHLPKYGTHLPEGGVAILLDEERRKGLSRDRLSFPMSPSFLKGGNVGPVSEVLSDLLVRHTISVDSAAIRELRDHWTLLSEEEVRIQETARITELEGQVAFLTEEVNRKTALLRDLKVGGEDLVQRMRETMEREQRAITRQKELRDELDRLLRMVRDSDLAKEREAREKAEDEAEVAEELLDEQMEELNRLRRENALLRAEMARAGAVATVPAQRTNGSQQAESQPQTWEDLLTWVSGLEYVTVGDVADGIDKLRGQTQERTWIQQTWRALRALEEYAWMKKERGAEEVPHFAAYLKDPSAERAIPWTKFSAVESKGVMMNSKFVAARTFRVPEEVDPSGRIVMEAHVRIGSGKPPAPRMHLHDDTSGVTGRIHIGHIGPHLPNYQTN